MASQRPCTHARTHTLARAQKPGAHAVDPAPDASLVDVAAAVLPAADALPILSLSASGPQQQLSALVTDAAPGTYAPYAPEEADGAAHMKGQDLVIRVDLGLGDGASTVWTCDLTHGYIDINADYRS